MSERGRGKGKLEGVRKARAVGREKTAIKHFAIFCGRDGVTGIVRDEREAESLTRGVDGAKLKVCDSRDQADRFIDFWLRKAGVRTWRHRDIAEAVEAPIDVEDSKGPRQLSDEIWAQAWSVLDPATGDEAQKAFADFCDKHDIRPIRDGEIFAKLLDIAGIEEQGK